MRTLSPRVDIAFKKIFGVEENKDLLISLINSIVEPYDHVSDVTLMNPYNLQSFRTDKLSIMDIKAKGHDGRLFNIEIQITDEGDYDKRALYYWAKMYSEQLRIGNEYEKLAKTIGIHILNFTSIIQSPQYHHRFTISDHANNVHYFNDFEMHTIELSKFSSNDEALTELVGKIRTSLDIWMAFLTRNDLLIRDHLPPELNESHLKKALDVLQIMNFTDEERDAYEGRAKFLGLEASALRKQRQKGKVEAQQEMTLKMIDEGIPDDLIIKLTNLTQTELNTLKASLAK